MRKLPVALAAISLTAVALAFQAAGKLVINGQAVAGSAISVKGQTYVPLSALKEAGATVTSANGTLSIVFNGDGGSTQLKGLEGKVGDWLFDGIWRFRVTDVKPNDDGRNGWLIGVELRNGTKADSLALDGTGFNSVQLVMDDGNVLTAPYNITDFVRPVGQSATIGTSLRYYDDDGGARKPVKLILRLAPDAPTVGFLKSMKLSYTVKDPSFRVTLGK